MSTPADAPQEQPPAPPPGRGRSRIGFRGLVVGAAVLALVIVGGVAAVFALTERDHRGDWDRLRPGPVPGLIDRHGPGPGRHGWYGAPGFDDAAVLAGTVSSTSADAVVVAADGGGERTVRVDGRTRVVGDSEVTVAGLRPGERVVVAVAGSGAGATARTIWTPHAHVTGTVTAVNGGRATVTGFDGTVVPVDVSGLTTPPAVGDVVTLSGSSSGDGVIHADRIRQLPKAS